MQRWTKASDERAETDGLIKGQSLRRCEKDKIHLVKEACLTTGVLSCVHFWRFWRRRISVVLEEEDAGMDEGLHEGAETGRRTGTPLGQGTK